MRPFFAGSLVLLGLVLVGCNRDNTHKGDGDKNEKPGTRESGQKVNERKPDFTTTAETLTKELDLDKKDSLKKYDGKMIEVTGKVYFVQKDGVFNLEGYTIGTWLGCGFFVEHGDKVHRFSTGQKVKVLGKGKNLFDIGFKLVECSIVELEPSNIKKVTAEELATEWDNAPAFDSEFDKKFSVRWIITGTIVDGPKKISVDGYHLYLRGTDKSRVIARINAESEKGLPKKGDSIDFAADNFRDGKGEMRFRKKDDDISCSAILLSPK